MKRETTAAAFEAVGAVEGTGLLNQGISPWTWFGRGGSGCGEDVRCAEVGDEGAEELGEDGEG